jgi:hypothetical protein
MVNFTISDELIRIVEIVVTLVLTLFISYWIAYKIAQKSKSFRKAELKVFLYKKSLIENPPEQIIFANSLPKGEEHIICPIPLEIRNVGDLTINDLVVNWKIPSIFRLNEEGIKMGQNFEVSNQPVKRTVRVFDNYHHISHNIPKINPRVGITLQELINIAPCNILVKADTVSLDKIPVEAEILLQAAFQIEIGIHAADIFPLGTKFEVFSYLAQDEKELIDIVIKNDRELIKKDLNKDMSERTAKNLANELYKMGALAPIERIIVIPKFKKIEDEGYYYFEQDVSKSYIRTIHKPKKPLPLLKLLSNKIFRSTNPRS